MFSDDNLCSFLSIAWVRKGAVCLQLTSLPSLLYQPPHFLSSRQIIYHISLIEILFSPSWREFELKPVYHFIYYNLFFVSHLWIK